MFNVRRNNLSSKDISYLFCPMIIKVSTAALSLLCSLSVIWPSFNVTKDEYTFAFYRIDNMVEIIVNDSLIYSSGEMKGNPDLEGNITYSIGHLLTDNEDVVIVKLYNGYAPYYDFKKDEHWEIDYAIFKNGQEIEQMWDEGDDYRTGLVFEEKYIF